MVPGKKPVKRMRRLTHSAKLERQRRLLQLKAKINNEEYLGEAIQRMASLLTNQLLDIPQGGIFHERKGRK
jgi:hypothetical protein